MGIPMLKLARIFGAVCAVVLMLACGSHEPEDESGYAEAVGYAPTDQFEVVLPEVGTDTPVMDLEAMDARVRDLQRMRDDGEMTADEFGALLESEGLAVFYNGVQNCGGMPGSPATQPGQTCWYCSHARTIWGGCLLDNAYEGSGLECQSPPLGPGFTCTPTANPASCGTVCSTIASVYAYIHQCDRPDLGADCNDYCWSAWMPSAYNCYRTTTGWALALCIVNYESNRGTPPNHDCPEHDGPPF